ncbi:MAG TPA: POTRA domain-containing protein [Candidatus Omnitrophota bacterium]|nr:POTRA domain-containing protein [Candidatus Omnitrophota bacterium]
MINRPYLKIAALLILYSALDTYSLAETNFGPATRETDRAVSDSETRKLMDKTRPPRKISISVDTSDTTSAEPSEDIKFYINDIRFTGMKSLAPEDLSFITKKYVKKDISAKDMKKLTKEIELEYLRRGIISSVFVPSQEVTDEVLNIQVLEPDTQ